MEHQIEEAVLRVTEAKEEVEMWKKMREKDENWGKYTVTVDPMIAAIEQLQIANQNMTRLIARLGPHLAKQEKLNQETIALWEKENGRKYTPFIPQ